ncbi:aminomethyl transferase family protein [Candidatus Poribacteria bacterium]|nr:aminomethyl transferase family protein [Candidatus Poribacteria bacterium]
MSTPKIPIKLTPLYFITQRLDATFTEQRGWRIPEVYTTLEVEIAAARERLALVDETANGKLLLEGDQAESVLMDAFDLGPLKINDGCDGIYRLRNDLFFISTPPGREVHTQKKLTTASAASEQFVTVTEVTHGRVEIRVIGPDSQALLSKVCGLDFHPSAFPNETAKQSSLAKTTQLIIRRDIGELSAFSIIGSQSLGSYVWDTMMEAGREFGVVPIGRAALAALADE